MKYYLHYKDNQVVGCGQIEIISNEIECREVTQEEYEEYEQQIEQERERKDNLYNQIQELKIQLQKYKEDVEQVELFGIERADYEDKKELCRNIILELRKLEKEIKG